MRAHNAEIGGAAARWNGGHRNEEHGVGTRDVGCALGQAVNFSGISVLPKGTLRAAAEFCVFSKFTSVRVEGVTVESGVRQGTVGSMICTDSR